MKKRTVNRVMYAQMVDMGGFPVRQPLPTQQVDQIDPFLLLHHAEAKISPDRDPDQQGVGPHPHRGFSPVTFIYGGGVHHRDSRGNDSTIYTGGVQWMNAGRGIVHSERPAKDIQDHGGVMEIIQLWINTPASHKMDQPAYFPLAKEEMPEILLDEDRMVARLVSGHYQGHQGPITPTSEVLSMNLELKAGGMHNFSLEEDFNAMVYVVRGDVRVEGFGMVEEKNLIYFNNDGEGIGIEAKTDGIALLLAARPLNEQVVSQGPFVMNNTTEILQAMRDYQTGKMGILIEE